MSEVKRGALQSKASASKTSETVVRHVQSIDAAGNVTGGGSEAFDDEVVTVADSAIGLTSATYLTATKAEMTLETAQIRVRKDGSDPTSSVGHIVEVGDLITLISASDIANFKAIRTGSTSGSLTVTYSE